MFLFHADLFLNLYGYFLKKNSYTAPVGAREVPLAHFCERQRELIFSFLEIKKYIPFQLKDATVTRVIVYSRKYYRFST